MLRIVALIAMCGLHSTYAIKPTASGSADTAWADVAAWLTQHGAVVSRKAKANLTHHGGAWIRGVIASEPMKKGETLLSIPKSLWMHLDNFAVSGLSNLKCNCNLEFQLLDSTLQSSVAVALEKKKGQASKWHAYLKDLPTLANYETFYIRMASPALLKQYQALPLAKYVKESQSALTACKPCVMKWAAKHAHDLTWNEVKHALAIWQTRVYGLDGENSTKVHALMPASDLLNTDTLGSLNTAWTPRPTYSNGERVFNVELTQPAAAGDELFDSYCPNCVNDRFLQIWSVYLDDNDHVKELDSEAAAAGEDLKKSVQRTLIGPHAGLTSPRCRPEVFERPQGPIECAFARLTWEQFGKSWGLKTPKRQSLLMRFDGSFEPHKATRSETHPLMTSRGMVLP